MLIPVLMLPGGIAATLFSANWLVEGSSSLARRFNISDLVIGLTIVAIGTSLPELATSVTAAYKGKTDLAVGNVIGSNILNIFLILGITSAIHPLPFDAGAMNHDLGLVMLSSLMLFLGAVVITPKRISKREGVVFTLTYVVYLVTLIFVD